MINQKLILPTSSKNKSLWETKYGRNEAYGRFVLIRYKVNGPELVTFIKVRIHGCLGFPALPFQKFTWKYFGSAVTETIWLGNVLVT